MMVRNMTQKERVDTRNCYKCFYQATWLSIMGWLIASISIQITWLVAIASYNEALEEVKPLTS